MVWRNMITVVTPSIRPEGLGIVASGLKHQTVKDFEWLVELNISDTPDFNKAMNNMLRRAKGELVVSIQDFIKIPDDGLERLWKAYKEKPAFYTCPVGQVDSFDDNPAWDWRTERENCNWTEWEIDYGSAPLKALKDIGGFDEELDNYWGFDNVNVGLRADMAGYEVTCLTDNRAIGVRHAPAKFQSIRNADFHNERLNTIRRGEILHYL